MWRWDVKQTAASGAWIIRAGNTGECLPEMCVVEVIAHNRRDISYGINLCLAIYVCVVCPMRDTMRW